MKEYVELDYDQNSTVVAKGILILIFTAILILGLAILLWPV